MLEERFLNTYHNASTTLDPDVPAEVTAFLRASDGVLTQTAELIRVLARAHQGAATLLIDGDWAHARKSFSLSEKYAAWADYRQPATGYGIHADALRSGAPIRLTDEQLRAHPDWKDFGGEIANHPPMRGWLAVPLIGSAGEHYGFLQASDRIDGDFTEGDESNLVRLATLTSAALEALVRLHPDIAASTHSRSQHEVRP
jgi:GAF domain-containing protein